MSTTEAGARHGSTRAARAVRKFAMYVSRALYRSVQIRRGTSSPPGSPDLFCANHFGGFSDPIVMIASTERMPRFLAAAAIWKVPLAKYVLNAVGAIPVLRSKDLAEHGGSNVDMFAEAHEALRDGDLVTIFPEGVSRDISRIDPIKTGAARIVLGAKAGGVSGIRIAPVGIHYADKAALRSRVFVNIGEPIDVDTELESIIGDDAVATDDHEAVRLLTDRIERAIREAAPDYENFEERRALRGAAEISLRSVDGSTEVPFAEREQIANTLAQRPEPQRRELVEKYEAYESEIEALGLDDAAIAAGISTGSFLGLLLRNIVVGALLLPFAIVGVLINWIPFLLVKLVDIRKMAAAMKATVKPLAAILVFGITWIAWAWYGFSRWELKGVAAVLLLMPVYLTAVIVLAERLVLIARSWAGWRRSRRSHRALLERLHTHRAEIVATVASA